MAKTFGLFLAGMNKAIQEMPFLLPNGTASSRTVRQMEIDTCYGIKNVIGGNRRERIALYNLK